MAQWKLKFLFGKHNKVEVTLPEGETIIGKDELIADIVLSDDNIHSQHLILHVTDSTVEITDASNVTSLTINDEYIKDKTNILLQPFDVVQLDEMIFTIGFIDDDLIDDVDVENDTVDHFNDVSGKISTTNTRALLISLSVIVIIIGFSFHLFTDKGHKKKVEIANIKNEPLENINQLIKKFKLNNLSVFLDNNTSTYIIDGYVDTKLKRKNIITKIDDLGIKYKNKIKSMDSIHQSVKFILSNFGYNQVSVINDDIPGSIILKGYIVDSTNWPKVEKMIQTDVPGLLAWKMDIKMVSDYIDKFKPMLDKADLLNKVELIDNKESIEARGELNKSEAADFYKVSKAFSDKFTGSPKVILKSIPSTSNINDINFNVKAIRFGDEPYVVLTNNIRYTIGARIPSGYSIVDISQSGVEMIKGEKQITIDFRSKK